MGHAEQAAGDIAGLYEYLAACRVVPYGFYAVVETLRDGAVLAPAAGRQLAGHIDMVCIDGSDGLVEFFAFRGQDACHTGGVHVLVSAPGAAADGAAGAVAAVVTDVEGRVSVWNGSLWAWAVLI